MALDDLFDFSALTPSGTVRYTLVGVCVPAANPASTVLIMKHAGRSNAGFTNALLKRRDDGSAGVRNAAALDVADERSAGTFARHVVIGWEGPVDAAGKPLAYTAELGELLLNKLIAAKRPDLVKGAFEFATDADNFRDSPGNAGDLGNA